MVKGYLDRILFGASIATVVAMLVVGYSYTANPDKYVLLGPVGLFFPFVLAANIGFLLFFLLLRKYRLMLVPFLGMLLAYQPIRVYCPLNTSPRIPDNCISVLSYNVLAFHGQNAEYGYTPQNPLVQYLLEKDCDIVCTQEDCFFLPDTVEQCLRTKYPYIQHNTNSTKSNGVGLYTKFPILSSDTLSIHSRGNLVAVYQLKMPHGILLLINCHLETNGLTHEDKSHFKSMVKGEMKRDSLEEESKGLFSKLAYASKIRARQMQVVMDYVKSHKGMKIVLCGDFNEGPLSYSHYLASQQLTDCYAESATGLGWSYCHNAMRVRIDNIFCSQGITPYDCHVDNSVDYSDHFPIMAKLKFD